MKRFLMIAALLSVATAATAARLTPDEQLAKAIEGRVAGEPVKCIHLRDIRSTRVIDKTAIVYDTLGPTIYVNRPKAGAAFLRDDAILVTDTHSSELCNIDIVKLMDPGSRMLSGSVGLGDFVPYTKPKTDRRD
ncbi:MAG TPA: hypothetical protein VLF18_03075 [Tahibacter sp.]|uniref:hypothetical protein n=1 Tax=Tahibacter sp. TaxID=2056211 RepID=UPI002BE5EAC5|nr:hypothetical protein [Tahibacter sp.]HSX59162.1 hypothetical protein [Tahibacter sp.]